jgi:hypothetical protein
MSAGGCRVPRETGMQVARPARGKVMAFHVSADGGNREQVMKRVGFGELEAAASDKTRRCRRLTDAGISSSPPSHLQTGREDAFRTIRPALSVRVVAPRSPEANPGGSSRALGATALELSVALWRNLRLVNRRDGRRACSSGLKSTQLRGAPHRSLRRNEVGAIDVG